MIVMTPQALEGRDRGGHQAPRDDGRPRGRDAGRADDGDRRDRRSRGRRGARPRRDERGRSRRADLAAVQARVVRAQPPRADGLEVDGAPDRGGGHVLPDRRAVHGRVARADARGGARGRRAAPSMLRGGAFKPRTSPFAFKGLGVPALEILAEARAETGLPVVTELLDTQHADVDPRARRRRADRRAQHAELRAARGRRQARQAGAAQARAVVVAGRAAAGRRLHPQGGQRGRDPVRARDPHVRDRDPLHARPRRGAVAQAAHPPAGDRRPVARGGRPPPGRAARRARPRRSAPTASSSRSTRTPRPRSATARRRCTPRASREYAARRRGPRRAAGQALA